MIYSSLDIEKFNIEDIDESQLIDGFAQDGCVYIKFKYDLDGNIYVYEIKDIYDEEVENE
jgi:hypothetical protein